jgi:hypothetical protein
MNKAKGKQMNIGKDSMAGMAGMAGIAGMAGNRGNGNSGPSGEPVFTIDTIIEVLTVLGYKNPNQGQAPGKNEPLMSGSGGGGDDLQKLLSMLG